MAGGEIGLESAALVANRSGKGEGWGEAARSAEKGQGNVQNLTLDVVLVADSDISVRSASLRCLRFCVLNTRRLDITAPKLEILGASNVADAHIAAPNLVEVDFSNILGQVVVADAGRHLRLLDVTWCSTMVASSLMRRFDSVINLRLRNPNDDDYRTFLDCTKILPKCEILSVSSTVVRNHAFEPSLLHLLRRANGIRRLILFFLYPSMNPRCSLDCPCRLPESPTSNKIILDSLEDIQILTAGGSADRADKFVELLNQLLSTIWSTTKLTKLKSVEMNLWFHGSPLSDDLCKKICGMCPPNIRIKSNVFPEGFMQH
nr:uncharacterized protein LOC127331322 [Lolium perenne]